MGIVPSQSGSINREGASPVARSLEQPGTGGNRSAPDAAFADAGVPPAIGDLPLEDTVARKPLLSEAEKLVKLS